MVAKARTVVTFSSYLQLVEPERHLLGYRICFITEQLFHRCVHINLHILKNVALYVMQVISE